MQSPIDLNQLSDAELRQMASMLAQLGERDALLADKAARIADQDARLAEQAAALTAHDEVIRRYGIREEQRTHEIALLKRHRFGKRSEGVNRQQYSMLEELVDEDTAAIEQELERLAESRPRPEPKTRAPKRRSLPPQLPRTEICHEPEHTTCTCGCALTRIGEDISKKLDYEPGSFSVERHIRGKWACRQSKTVTQAPVTPHVIDKGIPTTNLLAQVLVSKYADHLPLYRQEQIYARAGVELPRSTLADWRTGGLARSAGLRRLHRLQGRLRHGHDRSRLLGTRPTKVPRADGAHPKPHRREDANVHRHAL